MSGHKCKTSPCYHIDHFCFEYQYVYFKRKLHEALKDCEFNGESMRRLISEFDDEVNGS